MSLDRESILSEIRRLAEKNGVAPGRMAIRTEAGIRDSDWCGRYWARWSYAVREAGLPPNTKQESIPADELIERLIDLTRELGRFPVRAEIRMKRTTDPTFPSHNTFSRLGTKLQAIAKVIAYCESRDGFDDVTEACRSSINTSETAQVEASRTTAPSGFVYLLRSGRFYKIGRTNAAGRRERELAIQLPEKSVTVHVIRTDDPTGIEAYWHHRFVDRRKNGEWFDLTPADIPAFKRRRFV